MRLSNYLSSLVSGETWKSFYHTGVVELLEVNCATADLWQKQTNKTPKNSQPKTKKLHKNCSIHPQICPTIDATWKEELLSSQWGCGFFCPTVSKLVKESHGVLFQKGSVVEPWRKEGITNNPHFCWQGTWWAGNRHCVSREQFFCSWWAPRLVLRGCYMRVLFLES